MRTLIKKYAVWKHNRIIKMSDDKQKLIDYINSLQVIDKNKVWLARNEFWGWVGEPMGARHDEKTV
ncbi:MAG: hypothetical protein AB1349_13855 [Elusimicrobiota bacterium]